MRVKVRGKKPRGEAESRSLRSIVHSSVVLGKQTYGPILPKRRGPDRQSN